ncbi:NAD(P)-binding protein [Halorubrum sp. SD626R]|uniref:NAD(P)-binding protein n=1 Tax=Halorubrum sp. SD626R TaxID=1419722 RepID=UPI0013052E30|nr:NAD(P)-binding protein [Halorubrum sp. SD626R]
MTNIGIVGAGAAAAAAAFVLADAAPDADVTVLEKSGGLCGRAATRRHEDLTYDYGANYLKSDDDRVVELVTETLDDEGLADIDEPVYTFDADGAVSPGRDADDRKWSYRGGLTQIAKRLFARTDATVHRRTRVETVRQVGSDTAAGDDVRDGATTLLEGVGAAERSDPDRVGALGLARSVRDPEVQYGLGYVIAISKAIGRSRAADGD